MADPVAASYVRQSPPAIRPNLLPSGTRQRHRRHPRRRDEDGLRRRRQHVDLHARSGQGGALNDPMFHAPRRVPGWGSATAAASAWTGNSPSSAMSRGVAALLAARRRALSSNRHHLLRRASRPELWPDRCCIRDRRPASENCTWHNPTSSRRTRAASSWPETTSRGSASSTSPTGRRRRRPRRDPAPLGNPDSTNRRLASSSGGDWSSYH